jgi:drug/metabolite transporter (DMT)-like permease
MPVPFVGELAALGAAWLWATSSVIYGILGQKLSPLWLNLSKGVVAIALMLLTLILTRSAFPAIGAFPLAMLAISGAVGIGLGDTAYFTALNYLGARRTLLMETLAPLFASLLAWIFLQEALTLQAWSGIGLTLIGIAWVIGERTQGSVVTRRQPLVGVFWGILSALGQAVGSVLTRFALVDSEISPLWSALIRLVAGTACILVLMALKARRSPDRSWESPHWSRRLAGAIALTALGSTYLGLWLQQTSLKFAPVGISQTLIGTSPLFVIPIALLMGEVVSLQSIMGVVVAVLGVALLMLSGA